MNTMMEADTANELLSELCNERTRFAVAQYEISPMVDLDWMLGWE